MASDAQPRSPEEALQAALQTPEQRPAKPGAAAAGKKTRKMPGKTGRARAREFIVVTPSIEAQQGNDVVVRLKDGRKLLKQLNWARDGEVQLLSINNGYAPMTIPVTDIDSIHRVAGGVPPDAFQDA